MNEKKYDTPLGSAFVFVMAASFAYFTWLAPNNKDANYKKPSIIIENSLQNDTKTTELDSAALKQQQENLLVAEALKSARFYSKSENKTAIQNIFNNLENHFIAVNYNGTLDFFIDCFAEEPGVFTQRYGNPGERNHNRYMKTNAQGLIDKEAIEIRFDDYLLNDYGDVDEISVTTSYLDKGIYSYIFNQSPRLDSLAEGYYGRGLVALNEYAEKDIFEHSGPAIKPLSDLAKNESMKNNGAEKNIKVFGRRVRSIENRMLEDMNQWEKNGYWTQGIMVIETRPDQLIWPYNDKGATAGMFLTENSMEARFTEKDYSIILVDDKSNGYGDVDWIILKTGNKSKTLFDASQGTRDMVRRLYYTAIRGIQDLCWADHGLAGPEISEMKSHIMNDLNR